MTTVPHQSRPGRTGAAVGSELKALAIALGVTVFGVVVILSGWVLMRAASVRLAPDPVRDALIAQQEAAREEEARLAKLGPPGSPLDLTMVARGKRLYEAACITCHGATARGVPNMGKDLISSRFTKKVSDAELAAFIVKGRAADDPVNITQKAMPARGGRADFTDAHLADVVGYLRALQDPRRAPGALPEVTIAVLDAEDPVPATPVVDAKAVVGQATPSALDPQGVTRGKKVFSSCIACHAKTGAGVPKMGADLLHSEFVKNKTDEELLAFVKKGRQPGEPGSKLNLAMPAKGGNPALKDEQLKDVIVYIRSLQQAAADAK